MKTWQIKKLGEVLNIQNGYAFDSKGFSSEDGVPLIRIRDLKQGINTETKYKGIKSLCKLIFYLYEYTYKISIIYFSLIA